MISNIDELQKNGVYKTYYEHFSVMSNQGGE